MEKDIRNKILLVVAGGAFLMLFALKGEASDSTIKEPAHIEEPPVTTSSPIIEEMPSEETTEPSTLYDPSLEDSDDEDASSEGND